MIKINLKKYFEFEFFKNVFTLTSGSVLAQVIPILAAPILTRIFSVEFFGIYFIYASIMGMLALISTLRLELAILIPDNDDDALNLLALSIISVFFFSLISLLLIIFFHKNILTFFDNDKISIYLYFIPLSIFLIGCFQSISYWSNRRKRYSHISEGKINKSIVSVLGQIFTGLTTIKNTGLIPGLILGQATALTHLFIRSISSLKHFMSIVSIQKMKVLIKKYKDIPIFNTTISLINSLSSQLPFLLMPGYFGTSVVGFYGLSHKIISAPVNLIGGSIGQVSFRKAGELLNAKISIFNLVKRNYLYIFSISIIPYLLIFIFAPFIFRIFGSEWNTAGIYAQILIPYLFLNFLNSSNSFVITLLNKQKALLVYDIFLLFFRFLSFYVGFHVFNSAKTAIILFSLTGLSFHLILFVFILYISKNSVKNFSQN